jgi:hypothetical protein
LKWDRCIDSASNGLIYAYSFYLDHMSQGWEALVLDDYRAVMPLTGKKKYGIHYLAQPFLTAQLGIFGRDVDAEMLEGFLKAIPKKFRYCDISLNHGNLFIKKPPEIYERANFVLNLNLRYEELEKNYRENIRRNIKRSREAGSYADDTVDISQVIELAVAQMQRGSEEIKINILNFRRLYDLLFEREMAKVYAIVSPTKQVLASAVFFFSHGRAYYILVGNHPDGRPIGASHALIDSFIQANAGKEIKLDFEGSDIRNLAFFYSSYGAAEERYAALRWNRLPFWMKWLKK